MTVRDDGVLKSSRWYVHFPGDAYALGPFEFGRVMTEEEAMEAVREWEGVESLPEGVECWTA